MKTGKRITKREELIVGRQYLKVYGYDPSQTIQFTCFRILKHFWRYYNEDNSYAWYILNTPSLIPSKYFLFLNDMGIDNLNSPNSCYELIED